METARMMLNPAERMTIPLNQNDTDDLDDTLPIELLDCVDSTTKEDWLSRGSPFSGKVNCAQTAHINERGTRTESSVFDPPLSSTRYKSDGSSSEFSDVSTTAECGSAYEEEILSADWKKNPNEDQFNSLLVPAASMEFEPLRCSTAVTVNDLIGLPMARPINTFKIRVDTNEFKSPRHEVVQQAESDEFKSLVCSTGNAAGTALKRETLEVVQRAESIEFSPLRCSTGLTTEDAVLKPTEVRPTSPEEYYTACDSHFVSALGITQANSCAEVKADGRSTKNANSPAVEVSSQELAIENGVDVGTDLSILMQCHLKIRNGRQIVSNLQGRPQIKFSLSNGTATIGKAFQSKPTSLEGKSEIPNKRPPNSNRLSNQGNRPPLSACNGINSKSVVGENRIKLNGHEHAYCALPSAIPALTKLNGPNDRQKGKPSRGNSPSSSEGRHSSPEDENRVLRAVENLGSTNIQKVISALATLDSARSGLLCKMLVDQRLIDNVYDFLSKMNRSVAHQVACVHATSLLLDLAKYSYSIESTWQNGDRIGLLFNLMLIWVSKDNTIFLNCATLLWVFCQDETRANIVRRFVTVQNKLLEKISVKLSANTKILRPANKVPTLQPSWTNSRALRTFETPCSAFSALSAVLKKLSIGVK